MTTRVKALFANDKKLLVEQIQGVIQELCLGNDTKNNEALLDEFEKALDFEYTVVCNVSFTPDATEITGQHEENDWNTATAPCWTYYDIDEWDEDPRDGMVEVDSYVVEVDFDSVQLKETNDCEEEEEEQEEKEEDYEDWAEANREAATKNAALVGIKEIGKQNGLSTRDLINLLLEEKFGNNNPL